MKKVIIAGSSRKDGDTEKLVNQLADLSGWDVIDLNDYQFGYYDYEHLNRDDDYLGLMQKLIAEYDVFVFATPVYWYSMSGIMKVFFDRITDLLTIKKDLGRKLRGKKMAAISCSIGNNLGETFWLPFSETAGYLGMDYLGHVHTITDKDETARIAEFVQQVNEERWKPVDTGNVIKS